MSRVLDFDDNSLLPMLYGSCDQNLKRLEQKLDLRIASRGNRLSLSGHSREGVTTAVIVLKALYERVEKGLGVVSADVDAVLRMTAVQPDGDFFEQTRAVAATHSHDMAIVMRKRKLNPRSPGQVAYLKALEKHELVFATGAAGTGKTYLAVAYGVSLMLQGKVERIVLSRPAVEAGERLGFLPGDMKDKVDPYLRPLYDALYDMLPAEKVHSRLEAGDIEIAPLAFMRGRTLSNAFVILDEAQNTTAVQMKMFLTRLGENSRMVVTGDLSQIDLPQNGFGGAQSCGLKDALDTLAHLDDVGFVHFAASDIVRHALVTKIVHAYEARQHKDRAPENNGENSAESPVP